MRPPLDGGTAGLRDAFVVLLLIALPALDLVVETGGSAPLALLVLTGIVVSVRHRSWRLLTRPEWILLSAVVLYVAVSGASLLWSDSVANGYKKFGTHARLLDIIPIYLLIRQLRPPPWAVWTGLLLGAAGTGVIAVYQTFWLEYTRAVGNNNAIHFGNLSLIMGVMSLGLLPRFWQMHPLAVLLPLGAGLSGLTASVLSETRGAWLAVPVMGLIFAWHYRRRWTGYIVVALLIVVPIIAYNVPSTGVYMRILGAQREVKAYFTFHRRDTSVGTRFEMLRAAWHVFEDHPLIGSGLGDFRDMVRPQVDAGLVSPHVLEFTDAHNEYTSTLMNRGLLGFGALMFLLLASFNVFRRAAGVTQPAQLRMVGLLGMLAVAGYMVHGLHNNVFLRGVSINIFDYVVGVLGALAFTGLAARASDTRNSGGRLREGGH